MCIHIAIASFRVSNDDDNIYSGVVVVVVDECVFVRRAWDDVCVEEESARGGLKYTTRDRATRRRVQRADAIRAH